MGCFGSPDVIGAVLDLIREALLWNLAPPVFIGLSQTSLQDVHGKRILDFFKTLPEDPSGGKGPGVHIEMYEVRIQHICTYHVHLMMAS